MNQFIEYLLPNFILMVSVLYCWHKLLNKPFKYNNIRLYITLVGLIIISILNYIITEKFIRIIIITVIFMIFVRYLFKEKIQKSIIMPIFYQLIVFISESIFAICIVLILGNNFDKLLNSFWGVFLTNVSVSVISIIFCTNKYIKQLLEKIFKLTDKIKNSQLILLSLIILIILNISNMSVYYEIKFISLLVFNFSIIIIVSVIVINTLITQNKLNKVNGKYNIALKSLNDYENMMSKYRIVNHENKNLLLTVRAMILNNEKEIPKYIDSIIEKKYIDDEKLLLKMAVIPSGGLRATVYSSIMKIKENKIDYDLIIDKKIKSINLIKYDTNTIIDICKIIGVFIDNAIEEVSKMKKRNITIEFFVEKSKINIKISNTCSSNVSIENIFKNGYTTKGEGRGYGLALVKQIVNDNKHLTNRIEYKKNVFSQILIIN